MIEKIKRVTTNNKDRNVNMTLERLKQKNDVEIENIMNYLDYLVEKINQKLM